MARAICGEFDVSAKEQNLMETLEEALEAISELRLDSAVVHCITNTVAQNFTANILLSAGATPSMTVAPDEVEFFSARSDAVLINLGTMDELRKQAIRKSMGVCRVEEKPFVLDPVMCHISPPRLELAQEVIAAAPGIIRLNGAEAEMLSTLFDNEASAVAISGKEDVLRFGRSEITIANGHPYLSKVTAVGCAQGALMAGLLAKTNNKMAAALGAFCWVGIAGEVAAEQCSGVGSFQAALIDQIQNIQMDQLKTKARLS